MNLIRLASWLLVLGAAALSGPNLPAQGLAACREVVSVIARRTGLLRSIQTAWPQARQPAAR